MKRACLAVLIVASAATAAHAEPRAWTAAKLVLPADVRIIGALDFDGFRGTELIRRQWGNAIARHQGLADMKDACGLDPAEQVRSAVIALDANRNGIVVFATKFSRGTFEACMAKLASNHAWTAPAVRWLDKDVLAVASSPDLLARMTAGGLSKDKSLLARLAAVKTDAAMWLLYASDDGMLLLGTTTKLAYGSAEVSPRAIRVEAHLVVDDAKAAASAVRKELDAGRANVPEQLASAYDSIAVKAVGRELVVTGAASQQQLADLAALAPH